MSDDPFIAGLKALLSQDKRLTAAALSRAAGLDESAIRKMLAGSGSSPKLSSALKIASALGKSIDEIVSFSGERAATTSSIPIVGTVGAGAKVPVFEVYEKGAGPRVACPPSLPNGDLVAVEVTGRSMEPIYFEGDLLFFRRETHDGVPSEAIGRTCVCEDAAGMGWVKQVKPGSSPGLFHLIALNPQSDNMHDVELKWATPVRLHWPAELVSKLDP